MDYEKQSIEILRMLAGDTGFTVADSGGKDSSVLTHIAMECLNGGWMKNGTRIK